jgi:HAD superfamily hydrolase (TIGR01662 family)
MARKQNARQVTFVSKIYSLNTQAESTPSKVLILDRDNTINVDSGYTFKLEDLQLIQDSIKLLEVATQLKIPTVIISNQSVVNRGIATLNEVMKFNDALVTALDNLNCRIDAIIFCPHVPTENCDCRKPKIRMFLEVFEYYPTASDYCYIGDSRTDMEAAENAGIKFFSSLTKDGYIHAMNWLAE